MTEFLSSGLLGSLFGGLFRLAPELLKFLDRKNERQHELAMFQLQTDLEKVKGSFRMEEKYVDFSTAQVDAIKAAFQEQSATAQAAGKFVAGISALVRPGVTYIMVAFYAAVKITAICYALKSGAQWHEVLPAHWTPDDFAVLMLVITFWFVGRPVERYTGAGTK